MPTLTTPVVDLRHLAPPRPSGDAVKRYRLGPDGRPLVRAPGAIVGVGLHQTAVRFAVGPQAVKAAGGDEAAAKDARARQVAAHVVLWLYPPGPPRIVLVNPLRWHVNHGNGLNASTIGLEVEGAYDGRAAPEAWVLDPTQVQALHDCFRVIVAEAAKEGIVLRWTWGHRQSNGIKPADPGPELWHHGALWAEKELGLAVELDRTFPPSTPRVTPGLPIPRDWDVRSSHPYR